MNNINAKQHTRTVQGAAAPHRTILKGSAGRFCLMNWQPQQRRHDSVVVLPNGYGFLQYAKSVCEELSAHGYSVYTMNVRGQGESVGEYSIHGAAEDISVAIKHIKADEKSLHLLVHCSAAMPLIWLGANAPLWKSVKSVLLYCYLAEPEKHLARFRLKCERYGVRLAEDVGPLDCYGSAAYRTIPVPMAVVHPQVPANLQRASLAQLEELADHLDSAEITAPASGYNINSFSQHAVVQETVERDFLPLLTRTKG